MVESNTPEEAEQGDDLDWFEDLPLEDDEPDQVQPTGTPTSIDQAGTRAVPPPLPEAGTPTPTDSTSMPEGWMHQAGRAMRNVMSDKKISRRAVLISGGTAAAALAVGGLTQIKGCGSGPKEKTEDDLLKTAKDDPLELMPKDGSYTEEQWKELTPQQMVTDYKLRESMVHEGVMDKETGELKWEMEMNPDNEQAKGNAIAHALGMPSWTSAAYALEQMAIGINNWGWESHTSEAGHSIEQIDEITGKDALRRMKSRVRGSLKWLDKIDNVIRNIGEPAAFFSLAFLWQGLHDIAEIQYDYQRLLGSGRSTSRFAGNVAGFALMYPILRKLRGGIVLKRNAETTEVIERMKAALGQIDTKLQGVSNQEDSRTKHERETELQTLRNTGELAKAEAEARGKIEAEQAKERAEQHKKERTQEEVRLAALRVKELEQQFREAQAERAREQQELAAARQLAQEKQTALDAALANRVPDQARIDQLEAALAAAQADVQREVREGAAAEQKEREASEKLEKAEQQASDEQNPSDVPPAGE